MEPSEARIKALELAGWVAEADETFTPTVAWLLTSAANIEKYILLGETWAGHRPPPPTSVNA